MAGRKIVARAFVGGRPIEELTAEEKERFSETLVQRLGSGLNEYFGREPEKYIQFCRSAEGEART